MREAQGVKNLSFPKKIYWISGPPAVGKNILEAVIMEETGLTTKPILTGSFLAEQGLVKRISRGILIDDKLVMHLLLSEIMDPKYKDGVIIEGYPRTGIQVESLKLLQQKLNEVSAKKVDFHVIMLYIDKEESLHRQLVRGRRAIEHNMRVKKTGQGILERVRQTDMIESLARKRVNDYFESIYSNIDTLRDALHFKDIDASVPEMELREKLRAELERQKKEIAECRRKANQDKKPSFL